MGLIHIIAVCALGLALGLISMKLTDKMIADRLEADMKVVGIKNKFTPYIWMGLMAAAAVLLYLAEASWILLAEGMIIISICACIGMTDISIRRVPNQLLLALLCTKTVMIIFDIAVNKKFELGMIAEPIVGLFFAYLIFTFPVQLGVSIGAGDVKYAAVVGFYYGIFGFFQTMAVAGVGVFVYYLHLRITKKGNRKSLVAMGPFISVGMIAVMLLNTL